MLGLNSVVSLPRDLLKLFTTPELINWKDLCGTFESELKLGSAGNPPTHVFNTKQEGGVKRWGDLKTRVVEHVRFGSISSQIITIVLFYILVVDFKIY